MKSSESLSRRTFLKRTFAAAAVLPLGASLAACAAPAGEPEPQSEGADTANQVDQEGDKAQPNVSSGPTSSILVAYFSATGNTRGVAEKIASHLGADVFAIEPVEPYSAEDLDYNNSDSRTSREHDDPVRHVDLVQSEPQGFDSYRTVFVGYPIWWGQASWVIEDFIVENDFSDKTVIPFCTSGSSPIGNTGVNLAGFAGTGEWLEGERFAASATEEEVAAWVDELGLQD